MQTSTLEAATPAPVTPEVAGPAQPQAPKPEAQAFGADLALTRMKSDMRYKITEGATDINEIRTAEESIYREILAEQQAEIIALAEADPIVQDAKARGWSPEAEKEADLDPGNRVGAKNLSEIGIRVEAARQRHAMMTWGKFAEQSPQTAAKFASENKDIRIAIDRYKQYKFQEAQRTVGTRTRELASGDERYTAALATNNRRVMQLVESQMQEQALSEYISTNPDTARFLTESTGDAVLKTGYEKHLTAQEARKAELAAQAAKDGGEAGLKRIANGPEISWEGINVKPLEGPDVSWGGLDTVSPPTTQEPLHDLPSEAYDASRKTRNTDIPTISADGNILSYDTGDLRTDLRPSTPKTEATLNQPISYAEKITTYSLDLKALWGNLTSEQISTDPVFKDIAENFGGDIDKFISARRNWLEANKNPKQNIDSAISLTLKNIRDKAASTLGKEKTLEILTPDRERRKATAESSAARPNETGKFEPKIIDGVAYHPDHLPDAYRKSDGSIGYTGGVKFIGEANPEASQAPEKPKPTTERLIDAGNLSRQLALTLEEARKNGRPAAEIQALEAKSKEASSNFNAVLYEILVEGMVTNVRNEKNPDKRKRTAQEIVNNEKDKNKRDSLAAAFLKAGIQVAALAVVSTDAIRRTG